jgi:PAS domain S-box-containing protein
MQVLGLAAFLFISIYLFLSNYKKRNKQNLFAIINNTENLIWSIDKRFRYLAFNQAYEQKHHELFGTSVKIGDLVWNKKLPIEQVLQWKQLFNRALQGEKFFVDLDYTEEAGKPCYISVSFNPIFDSENEVAGVGCFLQDITQRLLHEAEINQQNKQFREIAFTISHTVRAPLSNILGLVEVIDEESPLNEVNKKIVAYIKVSAKELDTVVRNVVDRTVKFNRESSATGAA